MSCPFVRMDVNIQTRKWIDTSSPMTYGYLESKKPGLFKIDMRRIKEHEKWGVCRGGGERQKHHKNAAKEKKKLATEKRRPAKRK